MKELMIEGHKGYERGQKETKFSAVKKWGKRVLLSTFLAGSIASIGMYRHMKKVEQTIPSGEEIKEKIILDRALASEYYTADSLYLGRHGGRNHEFIEYEDINDSLILSAVATEDRRFFEHSGVDFTALGGALVSSVFGNRRGGSTITAQLIKNTYGRENYQGVSEFVDIKMKEFLMAHSLEQSFASKQEAKKFVLEAYLNNFWFDNHGSGIEGAAMRMFGKSQNELTLDECAAILSRAVSPSSVNYFSSKEGSKSLALQAKNAVLRDLQRAIKKDAFDNVFPELDGADLRIDKLLGANPFIGKDIPHGDSYWDIGTTYYMKRLVDEAAKIGSANQKITTTLDAALQNGLVEIFEDFIYAIDTRVSVLTPEQHIEFGGIVTDNAGKVRAYLGGRDKTNTKVFDRVQNDVETGSVIKSLIVGLALQEGVISSIDETFKDVGYVIKKSDFGTLRDRKPKNYGGGYTGKTFTIKEGLIQSKNSMMAYILRKGGPEFLEKIYAYFDQIGLEYNKVVDGNSLSPQVVLGGGGFEMSPEDIHILYQTFYSDTTEIGSLQYIESVRNTITGEEKVLSPRVFKGSMLDSAIKSDVRDALLEKGRRETSKHFPGGLDNVMIKTGTTGHANKYWMTIMTPDLHFTFMVGFDAQYNNGLPIGADNSYYGSSSRVFGELLGPLFTYLIDHGKYFPGSGNSVASKKNKLPHRSPDMKKHTHEFQTLVDALFPQKHKLFPIGDEDLSLDEAATSTSLTGAGDTDENEGSHTVLDAIPSGKYYNELGSSKDPSSNINELLALMRTYKLASAGKECIIYFNTGQDPSMLDNINKLAYTYKGSGVQTYVCNNWGNTEYWLELHENTTLDIVPPNSLVNNYLLLTSQGDGTVISESHRDIKNIVNNIKSQD